VRIGICHRTRRRGRPGSATGAAEAGGVSARLPTLPRAAGSPGSNAILIAEGHAPPCRQPCRPHRPQHTDAESLPRAASSVAGRARDAAHRSRRLRAKRHAPCLPPTMSSSCWLSRWPAPNRARPRLLISAEGLRRKSLLSDPCASTRGEPHVTLRYFPVRRIIANAHLPDCRPL